MVIGLSLLKRKIFVWWCLHQEICYYLQSTSSAGSSCFDTFLPHVLLLSCPSQWHINSLHLWIRMFFCKQDCLFWGLDLDTADAKKDLIMLMFKESWLNAMFVATFLLFLLVSNVMWLKCARLSEQNLSFCHLVIYTCAQGNIFLFERKEFG